MKIFLNFKWILCIPIALFAYYLWPFSDGIKHYTEEDLVGLNCAELSEKNEEVVFAYHDASLAHFRKTGAFEEDIGLPQEDVLPIVIVMKKVIRENAIEGFDLSKPFFQPAPVATPKLHSDFRLEVSRICVVNREMEAVEAILQAARNFELIAP